MTMQLKTGKCLKIKEWLSGIQMPGDNDEAGLASLIITIASINVWNRLNVSTRQVAGPWTADTGSQAA